MIGIANQAEVRNRASRIGIAGTTAGKQHGVRGGEHHALQLSGAHGRMALDVKRGHTADRWGGDGRPAQLDVLRAHQRHRIVEREAAVWSQRGDDVPAGRDEIGLEDAVLRRAVAGEAGKRIIEAPQVFQRNATVRTLHCSVHCCRLRPPQRCLSTTHTRRRRRSDWCGRFPRQTLAKRGSTRGC